MTTKTTQKTKVILNELATHLEALLREESLHARMFLFIIHDWVCHLCDKDTFLLDRYDLTLKEVLLEKSQISYRDWFFKILYHKPTLNVLAYRHHVVKETLERELFLNIDDSVIYTLMLSMSYSNVRFSPLGEFDHWSFVDSGKLITQLRQKDRHIKPVIDHLGNREDVTPYRLDRDHGLLSSEVLTYTLYIALALLEYEELTKPSENLPIMREHIATTIRHLKGVFFDVKDQWIGINVR